MVLSRLQRYILLQTLAVSKRTMSRSSIARFYHDATNRPNGKDLVTTISRSLDRLIARGLLVGCGRKTAHKWYIESTHLTPKGRRVARRLLGEQQALPLGIKRRKAKPTQRLTTKLTT